MFYIIKIKSKQDEYSLESSDKDIVQREMDLYFASFFGASQEFKDKILKLEFKHENPSPNLNKNNSKEYIIKDNESKSNNVKEFTKNKNDSVLINKNEVTNDTFKNIKNETNNIEEKITKNNIIPEDIIPDEIKSEDILNKAIVTTNNSNNQMSVTDVTKFLNKTSVENKKEDSNQDIKLFRLQSEVKNIENDSQIHVSGVENNKQIQEFIFKNDSDKNKEKSENSNISNETLTLKEEKPAQEQNVSQNSEENFTIENLIDNINKINEDQLTVSFNNEKQDSNENQEENQTKTDEENSKETNKDEISLMELAGLQIAIEDNNKNNDVNNVSTQSTQENEKNNIIENQIKTEQNISETASSKQTPDSELKKASESNKQENKDIQLLIPELQNIVNLVENNIELTNISQDNSEENLMDMFKPQNNAELMQEVIAINEALPLEDIETNSFYSEHEKTYEKNQEQLLNNIFTEENQENLITDSNIKDETEIKEIQNTVSNVDITSNSNTLPADNNINITDDKEFKLEDLASNTNQEQTKPIDDVPATQNSMVQEQSNNTGAVLDFKIFKAGFIVEEFVDDFLICAYYIKNILRNENFTMKFINSKLFNATGKFADMSIVGELIVNGYIKEVEGETSMLYSITPEGERYFVSKFQS